MSQLAMLTPQLAFIAPERLLILIVIPLLVAAYIFASRRKNRRGMRFTNTSMLDVVVPKQSQWRRHLAVALSLLSLITLTAAFARPKTVVDVPRERATVVLVIDASLSMQATDVQAEPAGRGQGGGDRVRQPAAGEVQRRGGVHGRLGGRPGAPDHRPQHGGERDPQHPGCRTRRAIGEGIATALSALRQAPKDPDDPDAVAPGAIVLLTDGKNTVGRAPLQAAGEAKAAEVPIYTIAYGTENGYVELDGKREPVPVDHEAMKEIAELTEGRYFAAATADELKTVYENIGSVGRLREGRPRGDLPVRGLRPRPRRAGRPRRYFLGSKMAVMSRSPARTCPVATIRPRGSGSRQAHPRSWACPDPVLRSSPSEVADDPDALVPGAEPAVAAAADPGAGRALPVAGPAQEEPQQSIWAGRCSTWSSRATGPGCGTWPWACRS